MEATSAPRPHGLRIPRPRRFLASLSDERLVEHVRRGEPAAFEVLYDRHSAGILGFCRHMLRSATDAEDAVQHTFIAAHGDILRSGERDLHVKAWLYTIARNRCLTILRARREHVSDDDVELASDGFTDHVEQREDLRALLADVRKLPADQREALVLAEVGALSHADISEILGCEASKVKSLVFQARTALIDRRTARDTPCDEIREQLATLRGGALRRSHLRHHIEACPGCSEYRDQLRRQRAMLAVALPVIPSGALKANIFGSLGFGGSAAAATGGGATAAAGATGFAASAGPGLAKIGIVAALAAGGGTAVVASQANLPLVHKSTPAQTGAPGGDGGNGATGGAAGSTITDTSTGTSKASHTTTGSRRSSSGSEHGFTPTTGESNGERAREFAKTRGSKNGLAKKQAAAHARAKRIHRTKKAKAKVKKLAARPAPKALKPTKPVEPKAESAPTKPTTTTPRNTPQATEPSPPPGSEPAAAESAPAPASQRTGGGINKGLKSTTPTVVAGA